ncbi:hypothetical protein AB4487_24565, partial [Vibrio splendidus]
MKSSTPYCPSGYLPLNSSQCKKELREVGGESSSWSAERGLMFIGWNGAYIAPVLIVDLPYRHTDGWLYNNGSRVSRNSEKIVYETVRKKTSIKGMLASCPSGYTKSGSTCTKTLTKSVVKHCPSGSLNSGRCVVSPLRHSPVEETMATLYPRYSDDAAQQNAAAFRYLDNMFTLDPELGEIVSAMSSEKQSQDFSRLWASEDKSTADNALEVVEGFTALQPDLTYLKEILFDIYYDRAAAEFILANRSIDQARIDWISDDKFSAIILEQNRQNAVDILQRSLNEYWSLIDNHPQAYVTQLPQRDLQSARYLNGQGQHSPIFEGEALVVGYKDALLVYQMMNTLLEQQVHLSKLKAVYANTDT